jgi:Lipocalin-like domain
MGLSVNDRQAHAGCYSFHGDRVIHHVELSLFPNWVGGDQERLVELAGDGSSSVPAHCCWWAKQQVPRLVWERVDPSPGPPAAALAAAGGL